jgi:hypothetical protein
MELLIGSFEHHSEHLLGIPRVGIWTTESGWNSTGQCSTFRVHGQHYLKQNRITETLNAEGGISMTNKARILLFWGPHKSLCDNGTIRLPCLLALELFHLIRIPEEFGISP